MFGDKISIVVPVYNVEKYLRKCIDSLLIQTYSNIEIILVNDGSTDNSLAICLEYEHKNSCIRVINKRNEGVVATRECGIREANGDWIMFVDSDDHIRETMCADFMEILTKENAQMATLIKYTVRPNIDCKTNSIEALVALKYLCNLQFPTSMWSSIYPTKLAKKIAVDEKIHFFEDFVFNYQILHQIERVALCYKENYHYSNNADSINHQKLNDKRLSCLMIAPMLSPGGILYDAKLERDVPYAITHFLMSNLVVLDNREKSDAKYYSIIKDYSNKYFDVIWKAKNVPLIYKFLTMITKWSPRSVGYIMKLKKLR